MSNNVTVNGVDYSGISKVQLNAPDGATVVFRGDPVINELTITENGTYEVPEGVDGYNPVVVNVESSGSGEKILYMDAELLNAGGAYPADADDYTTAVIPAEATFVDVEAFANLPNLDTLIVNGDCEFETYTETIDKTTYYYNAISKYHVPIRKFVTEGRTAEIPSYLMREVGPLLEIAVSCPIGTYVFYGCNYLRKIALDGVTSIGIAAFQGCTHLIEATIPDTVTFFGSQMFLGCSKLSKVTLPDNMEYIPSSMFRQCTALTEISIPDGVTSIYDFAFGHCTALTEITIPEGVTTIGGYAFYYCTALTEITIPAGVTSIEAYTFTGCTNLATITILGTETTIADTTAIPSTTTIRGYSGSAAETWASENGYTFEVIEE